MTSTGEVSPKETIFIELDRKDPNESRTVVLSTKDQDYIFDQLRTGYPPKTAHVIFGRLKPGLESIAAQHQRPITIEEGELDLSLLADFIGYLRGLWGNPLKEESKVHYDTTPSGAVIIDMPQDNRYVRVNPNMQRFIYTESRDGQTPEYISTRLVHLQNKAELDLSAIYAETVERLRYYIIQKVRVHDRVEDDHWNKVRNPYGTNEEPTVKEDDIPQAPGPVTETQPTDPSSSSGNLGGSQQPQSSRQRGGRGGRGSRGPRESRGGRGSRGPRESRGGRGSRGESQLPTLLPKQR